jgi:hypothetical protein
MGEAIGVFAHIHVCTFADRSLYVLFRILWAGLQTEGRFGEDAVIDAAVYRGHQRYRARHAIHFLQLKFESGRSTRIACAVRSPGLSLKR